MADYDFQHIEEKWQAHWRATQLYRVTRNANKPKCYVLDMFPYPSGAGLHVGHPLGYIATDIYARFKKLKGFEVLHPMGFDAFGLPAEQYAIQTGRHPEDTTRENIARYKSQLDRMGFGYDWEREIKTCDPGYYKYTQWMFLQLFNAWFNPLKGKAEPIHTLTQQFATSGFTGWSEYVLTGGEEEELKAFTATEWNQWDEAKRMQVLQHFRLAYLSDAWVNWCPGLGTVLANDEVKDGVSERGGFPVERKRMKQWSLRITAYAERLLQGLETISWSDSMKDLQRNWIGKSVGCSVRFPMRDREGEIEVFTTRPDTLFGVSFITIAPEHDLAQVLATADRKAEVDAYILQAKNKSERERQADVKTVSGIFTGAYAVHPITKQPVPIWIGEYVLSGYGTGAVMAVPAHDTRDYAFAKHYELPILEVVSGGDISLEAYDAKEGVLINSGFLNGLQVPEAIARAIEVAESEGWGTRTVNYRLRDAAFGRQRYWGEPIPMYYKDGIPYPLPESALPLVLPEVDKFLPTESGDPPLARAKAWFWDEDNQQLVSGNTPGAYPLEATTMPGWAGSSWYFLRYMDPNNPNRFASEDDVNYWGQIDVYMGGAEHGTGHLLYVRFWTKVLYDLGFIPFDEPAKRLINQGMILGNSSFAHILNINAGEAHSGNFIFSSLLKEEDRLKIIRENGINKINSLNAGNKRIDVSLLTPDGKRSKDWDQTKSWIKKYYDLKHNVKFFPDNNEEFIFNTEVEKMSKSKLNVFNPDEICDQYGADTLRLYEMFLGPIEQHKPWSTQGIEGVFRFLRKLWRLVYDSSGQLVVTADEPTDQENKILHRLIKKIEYDVEHFSFNTSVSAFMIAVNELTDAKCSKKAILEPLLICLAPFAPHITEELWHVLGNEDSIHMQAFPIFDERYLTENSFTYPVSVNGKVRTNMVFGLDMPQAEIEQTVLADPDIAKWLNGQPPRKIIFVKGRIINLVV